MNKSRSSALPGVDDRLSAAPSGNTRMPSHAEKAPARPLLLVVDDEPPVLKIVERLAAKAGFEVAACGGSAEAPGR